MHDKPGTAISSRRFHKKEFLHVAAFVISATQAASVWLLYSTNSSSVASEQGQEIAMEMVMDGSYVHPSGSKPNMHQKVINLSEADARTFIACRLPGIR